MTEGTIVASIPAIGYLTAYLYEAEFANRYHIPLNLISIGMAAVIRNTIVAAIILHWGISYSVKICWKMAGDTDGSVPPVWLPLLFLTVPICALWMIWWPFFIVVIAAAIEALLKRRRRRNPNAKPILVATDPTTAKFAMLIPTLLWCYFAARGVGYRDAVDTAEFYVRPGTPELVVLRFYENRAIAAPFDRQHKRVKAEMRIIPLDSLGEGMRRDRVGPLAPE